VRFVLSLRNYVIRNGAVIRRVDVLEYSGNGGEDHGHALGWSAVANEDGSRKVPLIPGLLPADTWLMSRFPECAAAASRIAPALASFPWPVRGEIGTIGDGAVLQSVSTVRQVHAGPGTRIEAVHRVSNAVLCSTAHEASSVSDGVILEDAVLGLGCAVRGNVVARRVLLGSHAKLLDGARVTDVVLGDNSTIAGAEVSNSLLLPFHEQHHQSSFLIAAHIEGQDNIAAGAVLGSNHNSRAADGELVAGRGFWPALRTSVKHSSRFAPFTLLARGDYGYELDVPYPFALVSRNPAADELVVMPGYWWLYNPYALFRNQQKFQRRDRRQVRMQPLEYRFMAPDTAEAILFARKRLVTLAALQCGLPEERAATWLESAEGADAVIPDPNLENGRRPAQIIKSGRAFLGYREMLVYYLGQCVVTGFQADHSDMVQAAGLSTQASREWVVAGGQPTPAARAERIADDIRSGVFDSWDQVHEAWNRAWEEYAADRHGHALAVAAMLAGQALPAREQIAKLVEESTEVLAAAVRRAWKARRKDLENPFRRATRTDDLPPVSPAEDPVCAALEEERESYSVTARQVSAFLRGQAPGTPESWS
jgi:carbonic anhydrase/acetyltransferase-like protein (isoleucine patch superfamily)